MNCINGELRTRDDESVMTGGAPLRFGIAEMAIDAIPQDERVWVPQGSNVWFRPLLLN